MSLQEKGRGRLETQKRQSNMRTEAEMELGKPQSKECLESPKAERGKEGFSCRVFGKSAILKTLRFWASGPQNYERTKFCFKPLVYGYLLRQPRKQIQCPQGRTKLEPKSLDSPSFMFISLPPFHIL